MNLRWRLLGARVDLRHRRRRERPAGALALPGSGQIVARLAVGVDKGLADAGAVEVIARHDGQPVIVVAQPELGLVEVAAVVIAAPGRLLIDGHAIRAGEPARRGPTRSRDSPWLHAATREGMTPSRVRRSAL